MGTIPWPIYRYIYDETFCEIVQTRLAEKEVPVVRSEKQSTDKVISEMHFLQGELL